MHDSSIEALEKKINSYKSEGRVLKAKVVTCSIEEALRRNNQRYKETGRAVPRDYVKLSHKGVSAIFEEMIARKLYNEVEVIDTTTGTPVKIAEYKNGVFTIIKAKEYQAFLDKQYYKD